MNFKKSFLYSFTLLLTSTGCISKQTVVTRECFDQIELGTTVADFEEVLGKPFFIRNRGGGIVEYEYIERITMNQSEVIMERHYLLCVCNGRVIRKRTWSGNQPAFNEIYQDDPNDTEF